MSKTRSCDLNAARARHARHPSHGSRLGIEEAELFSSFDGGRGSFVTGNTNPTCPDASMADDA